MSNSKQLDEIVDKATSLNFEDLSSFSELSKRIKDIIEFSRSCGGNAFAYTNSLNNLIDSLRRPNLASKAGFQKKKSELKKILKGIYCS